MRISDWSSDVCSSDLLVRADHPLLQAILRRTQSAISLRLLLRSPLGFVWRYGMRLRTPESGADPLVLDALAMCDLVHMTLDLALATLEKGGGLAAADEAQIAGAVQDAAARIAVVWESERSEAHTSELQSLMRLSCGLFCLK